MIQKHRFKVLLAFSFVLGACQGGTPSYTLNPKENVDSTEGRPGQKPGDVDEATNLDPTIWPTDLLRSTPVICESPRSVVQHQSYLVWTTAAATERAGMRLAQFKIGEGANPRVPGDNQRPIFTANRGGNAFDIVFEGQLPYGNGGGQMPSRPHLILGSIVNKDTKAEVWSVLPEIRLETQSRMKTLPAWMSLAHAMRVNDNDFVLPAKGGSVFELYSKNASDMGFTRVKGLGLTTSDAFPVAAFDDAVVFERNTGSIWTLEVVENLRGTPARKTVGKTARFLADVEKDAFWAWTQKSTQEWTLNRYSLRSGSYVAESTDSPTLAQPFLARRFELANNKAGFLIARDDLKKIQLFSKNFELSSEIPYPTGAEKALSAKRAGATAVYVVEFDYTNGQNRSSLVHAGLSQLKGPITNSQCSNPNL